MIVLGLNFAHDGSACLVKDGKLLCAISSERVTRIKKFHGVTPEVINYLFDETGYGINDVDAIALSNHGGRQLDDAPNPIDLVHPVFNAVGGQVEIFCDGGIRRGSDIVKAIALGADACMIGRPFLYGLGAAGEKGVEWVLNFLKDGMHQTMALLGAKSLTDLNPDLIETRYKVRA